MTLALGLDIGSTSTKAVLVDVLTGVRIVHTSRRLTPDDVDGLVVATAAAARECLAHADAPVIAVGIAAMAESGAAFDASGVALTPLLRWDRHVDRRHLQQILDRDPHLPSRTGVPATTKPAAVTLGALRAERPEVFEAVRHWSGVAEIVAHALTGTRAIDHTLAARTMLLADDGWDEPLLRELGLSSRALPALRAPGERVDVTGPTAAQFGLPAGVPVHVAGHDHAVGAWAAGARQPGDVADSLGTSEAVVRISDGVDRAAAVAAGFAVSRTIDGSARTVLGGNPSCGALLADEERRRPGTLRTLRDAPTDAWETSPMTVLPYPAGRQCPDPDPAAQLRVIGDGVDRPRAVLQSLVLQGRWMRESIDAFVASRTASVIVLGSLADRYACWAPLIASAGIPTRRCLAAEPVAAGAALHAAVAEGAASPESTLPTRPVRAASAAGFDDAFDRFLTAARAVPVSPEGES
ncbi:FGGY family carbohydrate kinase [Microbacterium sp. ZW T5_56]|uniref:FGGY family carbohydrate kinase n=1 Tax=Microbacterium sp. ZW T5_56 TaxID=3378081 RepID=UPI00385518F9